MPSIPIEKRATHAVSRGDFAGSLPSVSLSAAYGYSGVVSATGRGILPAIQSSEVLGHDTNLLPSRQEFVVT